MIGRLRLDTRDLDRAKASVANFATSTGSAFGDLDRGLTQMQRSLGQTGEGLARFGERASVRATLPIVAGFGLATKAASSLEEQTNKTRVVFGDAAASVIAFGEGAADAIGQSERAALQAAATYGNLFRAIGIGERESAEMSTTLVKLSADLASFNEVSNEEAFLALRAGLVGEAEPLRKFGVNLSDIALRAEAVNLKLSDGKGVLDANAKAQAAYSLILKDTVLAQGDFERTQDSLANTGKKVQGNLENAAATMGEKLIPAALKLTNATNGLLDTFNELPDAAQNFTLVGLSALAAVGPVAYLAGNALKLKAALNAATVAAGAQSFGAGVAVASATRLAGAVTKVGLAGAGLFAVVQGLQAIGGEGSKAAVNLERLAAASDAVLAAKFRDLLSFDADTADKAFGAVLERSISEAQRVVDALEAAGVATGDWQQRINEATKAEASAVVAKERDAEVTEKAAKAIRGAASATDSFTGSVNDNSGSLGPHADKQEKAAEAAKEYTDALEGLLDATVSAANAEVNNRQATAGVADALDDVAAKERALVDARRDRTSASRDAISEERALNSVEDARTSLVDAERELAAARAGRGDRARTIADAEKALAKAQLDASRAPNMRAAVEAQERVADAQERVNRAREEGGAGADVAEASERLERARLDVRDAELSLSEQREARAEREAQAAQAVKAAEDSLAAARLNAQSAALQAASAARDLAAAQAESEGKPLTAAAEYRIYRDRLIEVKDLTAPGSELRTNLEGIINSLPPPETRFAVLADTEQPNAALESVRQGFLRLRDVVGAQGPTMFGPVGRSAGEAGARVTDIGAAIDLARAKATLPFRFGADVEPVTTALDGVLSQIDVIRADTENLLAGITVRSPALAGAGAVRPGVAGIAGEPRTPTTVNVTNNVTALGANADVARELDHRAAREVARAR